MLYDEFLITKTPVPRHAPSGRRTREIESRDERAAANETGEPRVTTRCYFGLPAPSRQ